MLIHILHFSVIMPKSQQMTEQLAANHNRLKRHQEDKNVINQMKVSRSKEKELSKSKSSDMSNLSNLVDAARFVESADNPKQSSKSKRRVKEPPKKKSRVPKNAKVLQKVPSKQDSSDDNRSSSDSESDPEDEIASIKQTMTVMMAKLEKLEGAKRRKRRNKKNKKNYSSDEEKVQKGTSKNDDNHTKVKNTSENATVNQPDYNNVNQMQLFQQMFMMQQQIGMMGPLYPSPFVVSPLNMVQQGLTNTGSSFPNPLTRPSFLFNKKSSLEQSNQIESEVVSVPKKNSGEDGERR